jgi:8-oxo-dGTP pyrophosphatase MutT (NUDIX family)
VASPASGALDVLVGNDAAGLARYCGAMPSYYRDPAAPAPNVPRRIGAAAVIERDGLFLVERRRDDESWGFVGGGVDEDETVLEALHREVLEETGLRIRTATLFGVFSDPSRIIAYPDGNICRVLSVVFRVRPLDGDAVASDESLELGWVTLEELAGLDFFRVQLPIREAVLAGAGEVVVA